MNTLPLLVGVALLVVTTACSVARFTVSDVLVSPAGWRGYVVCLWGSAASVLGDGIDQHYKTTKCEVKWRLTQIDRKSVGIIQKSHLQAVYYLFSSLHLY